MKKAVSLFIFLLSTGCIALAQPIRVAVAANAQFVMEALQKDFKKRTGIEIEPIMGSSGKLTAQIMNGAPYDVFLSADMSYPDKLYKAGFGLAQPREYALGSLIVCTASNLSISNWKELAITENVKKIAIANPALAPYGKAAEETLDHYGLLNKTRHKLVYGESIAQVNTYINTGVAQLGFTTEALAVELSGKTKLNWLRIDPKTYGEIQQGAILLKYAKTKNYQKAKKFYDYLFSAGAKAIFKRYGYQTR